LLIQLISSGSASSKETYDYQEPSQLHIDTT